MLSFEPKFFLRVPCSFKAGIGFVVRENVAEGGELFQVALAPRCSAASFGLVQHISGATLYQIDREINGKIGIHSVGARSAGGFSVAVTTNFCLKFAKRSFHMKSTRSKPQG